MDRLIAQALGRIIRWLGVQTLLSLLLLQMALGAVALGLADLIRDLEAGLLLPSAALGVLLGWLLAKSPLPGWLAGGLGAMLGAEVILVSVGGVADALTDLLSSVGGLLWGIWRWPFEGVPDGASVALAAEALGERVSELLNRVGNWSGALISGQAGFDPVAAGMVWGLIVWLAAFWAGWAVRRRQRTLQGIAPAGALLAVSLSYTWDHPYPLWILLAATLFLMVVTGQVARERRWQAAGMDFSLELRLELALVGIGLTTALLAVSLLMPSVSVRPVVRLARQWLVDHLSGGKQVADSMGLEPLAGEGIALNQARAAGLPTRSLIGSGPELSEQVVMLVQLEGQDYGSVTPSGQPDTSPHYYWRALTYDIYTGRGWLAGEAETMRYRAGEPAIYRTERDGEVSASSTALRRLRQKVQAVEDLGGLLYRAGELVTADPGFRVAWRSPDDLFGAEVDANVYRADSLVPFVSQAQLRAAGDHYPEWVRDRYLALPPQVPPRVRSLALRLTAEEPTPYDRARAIESYLRTFTYTLDLPAPPPNREIADYFLFDLKQGYCDYYATAMVVLARAAGLPARLVMGYATGTYDAEADRYIVTAADAHSWVEIYFPDYRWVEFEPTGGRSPIERPAEISPADLTASQTPLGPITRQRISSDQLIRLGLLGGLAVLLLGAVAWWFADIWRLRRLPPEEAIAALYQRLCRYGRWLAVPVKSGSTPYEFSAEITTRVAELGGARRAETALESALQRIDRLTALHVQGRYSPRKPGGAEKTEAIQAWRRLRPQLWRAWMRMFR